MLYFNDNNKKKKDPPPPRNKNTIGKYLGFYLRVWDF